MRAEPFEPEAREGVSAHSKRPAVDTSWPHTGVSACTPWPPLPSPRIHTINAKHIRVRQHLRRHGCAHCQNQFPRIETRAEFPRGLWALSSALPRRGVRQRGQRPEGQWPTVPVPHKSHKAKLKDAKQTVATRRCGQARPCLTWVSTIVSGGLALRGDHS